MKNESLIILPPFCNFVIPDIISKFNNLINKVLRHFYRIKLEKRCLIIRLPKIINNKTTPENRLLQLNSFSDMHDNLWLTFNALFYIFEGWKQNVPLIDQMPIKGDTIIGNDVWIGQNATILPSVHVGNGAIIGAKSVVRRNVDPYAIVAGNPARLIRRRFENEIISLLLKFKWWDRSVDEIQSLIPLLSSSNLNELKRELKIRLHI